MIKIIFLIFNLFFLTGCVKNYYKSNQNTTLHSERNKLQVNITGSNFLRTASIFTPNGALTDIKVGSMPYYWLAFNNEDKLYTRGIHTVSYFENGMKKINNNRENNSTITHISYGKYDKDELEEFLSSLNSESYRLVKHEVKDSDEEKTNIKVSIPIEENKLKKIPPYIIFAYNNISMQATSIRSPAEILLLEKNGTIDNYEFFLAIYPRISILNPGEDLGKYLENYSKKISETLHDKSSNDCAGFQRKLSDTLENKGQKSEKSNCPYLKFWLVDYLISAHSIISINKNLISQSNGLKVNVKDNSLSKISKMIFDNNIGLTMESNNSKNLLNSSSMFFSKREIKYEPLTWSCIKSKCIPAGPKESPELSALIPIYASIILDPQHLKKMIDEVPRFELDLINLTPIQ